MKITNKICDEIFIQFLNNLYIDIMYKQKYLKYKNKYLSLKGGVNLPDVFID
jgi:hypothetical protein